MSIEISSIKFKANPISVSEKSEKEPDEKQKQVSSKVVMASLGAIGVAALAIMMLKRKGGKLPKGNAQKQSVENILGRNPKVGNLTQEEKEKVIKELQSYTDNPNTKAEIRKLVENGEWDKLS